MGSFSTSYRCEYPGDQSARNTNPTDVECQVAVREIDTTEAIGIALVEILTSLGRWDKYAALFDEFERVRDAASHLFSQIINFLIRASLYYQKPRAREPPRTLPTILPPLRYPTSIRKLTLIVRHLKVGFTNWDQKFKDIMSHIRQHSIYLEGEGTLASALSKYYCGAIP